MGFGSSTGSSEVNIGSVDPDQGEERRERQCSTREKDSLGRQAVAYEAQRPGRYDTPYRGQTLIATKSLSECVVPNQAQTDSGDPRPEDAARRALHGGCNQDGRQIRPKPDDQ